MWPSAQATGCPSRDLVAHISHCYTQSMIDEALTLGPASLLGLLATFALLSTGCDEFATPAALSKTQVLAISAEPPVITPGASTTLEILVADSDGPVAAPDIAWSVATMNPGDLPIGVVEQMPDGRALYTAPASIAEEPTFASVLATIQLGESAPLTALKAVVILNSSVPLANPSITTFEVAGLDALSGEPVRVEAGQAVPIEFVTDPPSSDTSSFAWYATIGEIERYQSNPAELLVGDEPGSGWLIAVMRDGLGGVVWHQVAIEAE